MQSFSLTQLRHFVALVETGSFTAGAAATHRSQAAFSRSIAVLEQGLGVALIDRVGHVNELTPLGREFLQRARHVLAEADELARVVDDHAKPARFELRVGLGSTPSALLSGPLLARAAGLAGTTRLSIAQGSIETQLQALRERKLDALIVELRSIPAATDLVTECVVRLPNGFLCRPRHPLVEIRRPSLADIARYPVAATGISDEVARNMVARLGAAAHPSDWVSLCSEDVNALLRLACTSDALFMGVLANGRQLVAQGQLVALNFDAAGLEAEFGLVRLRGRSEASGLAALRELMEAQMQP